MIAIGIVALVIAVVQHKRRVDALRGMGLVPEWELAIAVASLVVAIIPCLLVSIAGTSLFGTGSKLRLPAGS